jgi:hypothetical protein
MLCVIEWKTDVAAVDSNGSPPLPRSTQDPGKHAIT